MKLIHSICAVIPCVIGGALLLPAPNSAKAADRTTSDLGSASISADTVHFSGMDWNVKTAEFSPVGPGLNYFAGSDSTVWVDSQGRLHLTIVERDGKWFCSEVYSQESCGYGEYIFYLASRDVEDLDPNVVLGLFTWDDSSFVSDGHGEIDIEFSHWGYDDGRMLMYSVQPVQEREFTERFKWIGLYLFGSYTTHIFEWRPDLVVFRSYHDHGNPTEWPIDNGWFDFHYPDSCRYRTWGDIQSDCIYIPHPSASTKVHMNLWLIDGPGDADVIGDSPTDGMEIEVVISGFEFNPAPTLDFVTNSSVDLRITNPDGNVISKEVEGIPGATYAEPDVHHGAVEGVVSIPCPIEGKYLIEMLPWENAVLTDSYSIFVLHEGDTCYCARDVLIQRIPLRGYVYDSATGNCGRVPGEFLFPDDYSLAVNRPNPFASSTAISYELPARSRVNISVYEVLGRRVLTLVDAEVQAGRHSVSWDGTDGFGDRVCPGVYVYRIDASSYSEARKMVLLQ